VVAQHYPEPKAGLVASATHKRGLTAWVEREGIINSGDEIVLWVPQQRLYAHVES
jgi:MOSC domain-containing protein YiiM